MRTLFDRKKSSRDDFFETLHGRRRQKAWFLPPAVSKLLRPGLDAN
jgi:hypothetical protein